MDRLKIISEIFQNFAVGIGALLAGLAGYKVILELFHDKKKRAKIRALMRDYPEKQINTDFELVFSPIAGQSNRIYILDHKTETRHWIASRQTLHDLQLSSDAAKRNYSQDSFNSYKEGDKLLTSGTPGS